MSNPVANVGNQINNTVGDKINNLINNGVTNKGQEILNNVANTISSGMNNLKGTIAENVNKITGPKNVLAENFSIVLALTITFIILLIMFFLSKTFRVSTTLDSFNLYKNFLSLSSYPFNDDEAKKIKLKDCYIASAYNPTLNQYQMLDYTSIDIFNEVYRAGPIYLEFNIFNSEYGENAIPIVSNGYKKGNWKLTADTVTFEECIKSLAENAFTVLQDDKTGVLNPDDPIFIGLNLNVENNVYCLDIISDILVNYFKNRFLDHKYSFQQNDLSNITMGELEGKVCIIASEGFEGSKLEELVNGCWDDSNIRHIHYSDLDKPGLDVNTWQSHNRSGLTIVTPNKEGDFYSTNYDTDIAFKCGCQFIALNYQIIDKHMDIYINKFKNKSIRVKPKRLTEIQVDDSNINNKK